MRLIGIIFKHTDTLSQFSLLSNFLHLVMSTGQLISYYNSLTGGEKSICAGRFCDEKQLSHQFECILEGKFTKFNCSSMKRISKSLYSVYIWFILMICCVTYVCLLLPGSAAGDWSSSSLFCWVARWPSELIRQRRL